MNASFSPIGAKLSATRRARCGRRGTRARAASGSGAARRRGTAASRSLLSAATPATPRQTTAVSRMSATTPEPRVRYHSVSCRPRRRLELRPVTPRCLRASRRRATTAPSSRPAAPAAGARASHAGASSPSTSDAVLAAFASTQVAAATRDRAPRRRGRAAGARVEDVVDALRRSLAPAPHGRADEVARPPPAMRDRRRRLGRRRVVVGDAARPAARRRRARDRDVAAEADEDAAPARCGRRARGAVGGERLGGRAEIELDPRGTRTVARGVELDLRPAGAALGPARKRVPSAGRTSRKVAVVAGEAQCRGRRSGSTSPSVAPRSVERDAQRLQSSGPTATRRPRRG